jgi:hypothetical protein
MESQKVTKVPTLVEQNNDKPDLSVFFIGFSSLIIIIIILYYLYNYTVYKTLITPPTTVTTGVSIYAVLYLIAQIDERIVELFSYSEFFGARNNKKRRTVTLWFLASTIGILLCYATTGLFEIINISFSIDSHLVDAILSGLVVGGGTKPLHDLISSVEKGSKKED